MEQKDEQTPYPREPWKRLLEAHADTPPETTDARIRAAARKAVAPRSARWWLPASLAASFVVAVVIAQMQYGRGGRQVVGEADMAAESRVDVKIVDRTQPISPPSRAPAAASKRAEAVTAQGRPPADDSDYEPESAAGEEPEVAEMRSRIGGPEHDLKAANEMPDEALGASPAPTIDLPATAAWQRTPEDWYARIVALRKAGRHLEADVELARFEAAWPDWLKQQGKPRP